MNNDNEAIGKKNEDYRNILATANKLEALQSSLESVIDYFLAPIVKLYNKLCNDCLKLLSEGDFKLDHFRKAEELVWRRVYHDVYRFQKTKRQRIKKQDECLIEAHFISGIGFYSSLIIRLRSRYRIYDVKGIISPLNLTLGPLDTFVDNQLLNDENEADCMTELTSTNIAGDNLMSIDQESQDESRSEKAQEWAKQSIYRSLVYMGDLARYLLETNQQDYRKLAFNFYCSASVNQPDYGLPFNQLATLASGLNHNLDAVCNYMRSCSRPRPYEGAKGNMRKLFELNNEFYSSLSNEDNVKKISQVLASDEPKKAAESMVRMVIVIFIRLTSNIWTLTSLDEDEILQDALVRDTQLFFEIIREALELDPIVPLANPASNFERDFCPISGGLNNSEKPRYISPTIMYEFCSIALMLISKSQKKETIKLSSPELPKNHVSNLAITLALNLLHYSTAKCHKMIMSKVQELRITRQNQLAPEKRIYARQQATDFNYKSSGGNLSTTGSQKSTDNIAPSNDSASRRTLSRLRQRKAAINYSDHNNRLKPIILHHEDSDMSELEETALSTIDALDISSEMSEDNDFKSNDLIDLGSSSDEVSSSMKQDNKQLSETSLCILSKPALRPTRSQNYELEKCFNLVDSSNSLPVPDLLTGDNFRVREANQTWLGSPYESESLIDKDLLLSTTSDTNEIDSVFAYIYKHTYLPTTKILCDWLLSNGEIISSNLQSFRAFCNELDELVNLLGELRKLIDINYQPSNTNYSPDVISTTITSSDESLLRLNSDSFIYKHIFDGPSWVQKYPMSCDFPLYNLSSLKSVHELNIDFSYQRELSESESGFITMQCVIAFSHALKTFLENKTSQ